LGKGVLDEGIDDFGGVIAGIFEEIDCVSGEGEVDRLTDSGDLRFVWHSIGFPCPVSPVATHGGV
jgi:hypothetical protein